MRQLITYKDQEKFVKMQIRNMRGGFSFIKKYVMPSNPLFKAKLKLILLTCKTLLSAFEYESFIVPNLHIYQAILYNLFERAERMLQKRKRR